MEFGNLYEYAEGMAGMNKNFLPIGRGIFVIAEIRNAVFFEEGFCLLNIRCLEGDVMHAPSRSARKLSRKLPGPVGLINSRRLKSPRE